MTNVLKHLCETIGIELCNCAHQFTSRISTVLCRMMKLVIVALFPC